MSLCCILYISWVLFIIYPVGKLSDSNKKLLYWMRRIRKLTTRTTTTTNKKKQHISRAPVIY